VVEESDILACQGLLPERCIGGTAGDSAIEHAAALADEVAIPEAGSSASEEGGLCETDENTCSDAPVMQEEREHDDRGRTEEAVEEGGGGSDLCLEGRGEECAEGPNEANFRDDVCIAQHEEAIEVSAISGGSSGLDNLKTKPISSQAKPVAVGDPEPGGTGDSKTGGTPSSDEQERRRASWERVRQEWMRSRGVKQAGEAVGSHDARGP
jgi:hypothetical protein